MLLIMYKFTDTVKWKDGACSGAVYNGSDDLTDIMAKVNYIS